VRRRMGNIPLRLREPGSFQSFQHVRGPEGARAGVVVATNAPANDPPTITGTDGAALTVGQVITGDAVRDVVLANSKIKVTYDDPETGQNGSHQLHVLVGGTWVPALDAGYRDYFYFVQTVSQVATSVTVLRADADAVEAIWEWPAHDITAANLDQINEAGQLIYPQSSANSRKHTTVNLRKRIRVERGAEGYFVGISSSPRVSPGESTEEAFEEEGNFGEQEIGLGPGSAVTRSSAGVTARHPAAGAHVDLDIDEQEEGPYWFLSIPADQEAFPFCRYCVLVTDIVSRSYQFNAPDRGVAVARQVFRVHAEQAHSHYQVYIAAFRYEADSSSSFANEPTPSVISEVESRAATLEWPV
jgi:hypothetical protein